MTELLGADCAEIKTSFIVYAIVALENFFLIKINALVLEQLCRFKKPNIKQMETNISFQKEGNIIYIIFTYVLKSLVLW